MFIEIPSDSSSPRGLIVVIGIFGSIFLDAIVDGFFPTQEKGRVGLCRGLGNFLYPMVILVLLKATNR